MFWVFGCFRLSFYVHTSLVQCWSVPCLNVRPGDSNRSAALVGEDHLFPDRKLCFHLPHLPLPLYAARIASISLGCPTLTTQKFPQEAPARQLHSEYLTTVAAFDWGSSTSFRFTSLFQGYALSGFSDPKKQRFVSLLNFFFFFMEATFPLRSFS